MKKIIFLFLILTVWSCTHAQTDKDLLGGPCEGCEAVYEYGACSLEATTVLPDYHQNGQQIKITGTVYKKDGKTPAPNVILYVYHTDQKGEYTANPGAVGWEKRHGSIRGWMKTDENGKYAFYTLKPGVYPSRTEPAHIHLIVKEPGKKEYYLDSYHFDNDALLTEKVRSEMDNRGGNGILELKKEGKVWIGKREVVLGENIPYYY